MISGSWFRTAPLAELHAVAHQVVLVGGDGQGIDLTPLGLQQHLQPAAGHGEGVVAELQLTALLADLVHGEVHDPAELVALLIHVTGAGGAEGLDEYTGGLGGCCAGRHHHQRIGCQRQNLLQLGPQAGDELGDTAGQLTLLIHLEPVGLAAGLHLARRHRSFSTCLRVRVQSEISTIFTVWPRRGLETRCLQRGG